MQRFARDGHLRATSLDLYRRLCLHQFAAPHLERRAANDFVNRRLERISIVRQLAGDLIDGAPLS